MPAAVQERYEIELHCGSCGRTTPHAVASGAGPLSRVMCIVCGHAIAVDTLQFMEQYVDSVMRRLLAKPFEITTQFRRQPRDFIASVPGRMLTKPFRVAAELRATLEIVRPSRHRKSSPGLRGAPRPAPRLPASAGRLPSAGRRCRILLSAPLMWAHDALEILEAARALGYDGVELWAYHLEESKADLDRVGGRARSLGLVLTLHGASWDLNPSSRLDGIRTASVDALLRSADTAARVGAATLVVHPGRVTMPYDDPEPYWPRLVAGIRAVADRAAAHGLTVAVEHMEPRPGEFVTAPEDVNRLIREVGRPNLGAVLDVAHIPWGEDEAAFLRRLDRLVHVHLSDADASRLHLPLGQGRRDLVRVLAALREYGGTIACEGFSLGAGADLARWNKARFEELWAEAAAVEEQVGGR